MEGVTVLSVSNSGVLFYAASLFGVIFFLLFVFVSIGAYTKEEFKIACNFAFLAIVAMICACITIPRSSLQKTYKVIVNEDVSFVEFTDRYSILKTDGDIWLVQERSQIDSEE